MASLLSGIIQGLGTVWGLFRHYWVLIKLVITALATVLLWVHLQPVTAMADVSLATDLGPSDMNAMRIQLVADAGAARLRICRTECLSVWAAKTQLLGVKVEMLGGVRVDLGESHHRVEERIPPVREGHGP